jgi:hypothetical protein
MRHFQLKPKLYLVETEVEHNTKTVEGPAHHVWVWDRSGSMYGDLSRLTQDIVDKIPTINKGDYLSLGWFSGNGQYDFITRGYKIGDDTADVQKLVKKYSDTVGLTCFSEIIKETEKVIDSLSTFTSNVSFVFFSDGCPTVGNYNKEVESVFMGLEKLKDKVTASLLIGYSHYYNKALMSDMAERIGGSVTHASSVPAFSQLLAEHNTTFREAGNKITIDAPVKGDLIFSVFGNSVVRYKPNNKNKISFTICKGAKDYLYTLTDKAPAKSEEVNLEKLGERNSFLKGMYGLAVSLSQTGDVQLATDVLGTIGDKKLIDSLYDAFTNDEYGAAEKNIGAAMASPSARFTGGKVLGYVKPDNAPCVLDALDVIAADETAEFFPYAGSGYARTGVKAEKTSEVEFVPADKGYSVSSLKWNSSRLNLNLTTEIEGHVELDDKAKKLGLTKEFPCKIFRSFTFVKDGILNVKQPVLKLSHETHEKLVAMGVTYSAGVGDSYTYDLSTLPIMNRSYANAIKSVKPFADLAVKEAELEGVVKVLKSEVKAAKEAAKAATAGSYGTQVEEYLAGFHINAAKGTFTPPTKKGEATDFYMGKTFEIKIKGLSSLPKVDDVRKKLAEKKKLTTADNVVVAGLNILDKTPKAKLEAELIARQEELLATRAQLLRSKFAIILGKAQFDEFKGERKEEYTFEHKGYDLTFKFGEVEVNY